MIITIKVMASVSNVSKKSQNIKGRMIAKNKLTPFESETQLS